MTEAEVIQLLQNRDEHGVDALLQMYSPMMCYIIAPILPDRRDAEECLSEAALRIWDKIDRFDSTKGSWRAWVTALTRRAALNKLRTVESVGDELHENMAAAAPTPEEALLHRERSETLERALARLSRSERVLFYRKYYYRQSTRQIALETGTTQRAVEGKLYRIKQFLRRQLGGEDDA